MLLLGHSFARRASAICPFRCNGVIVNASGVSGAGVDKLATSWQDACAEYNPDIVFIQSGENDIGDMPWQDIADRLLDFSRGLTNDGYKVVIGSKFKRYKCRRITPALYTVGRKKMNRYLRDQCKNTKKTEHRIRFCREFRPYQSENRFLPDGVHLTPATQMMWVKMIAKYCKDIEVQVRDEKDTFKPF